MILGNVEKSKYKSYILQMDILRFFKMNLNEIIET